MAATAISIPRLAQRTFNYSVMLNQNSSSLEIADTFSPTSSAFTVYLWLKVNFLPARYSPANDAVIFAQKNGTGTGAMWLYLDKTTNKMSSSLGGTSTWEFIPKEGQWYRVALTKYGTGAGTNLVLYINGVSYGAKTVNPAAASGNLIVGNDKNGTSGAYISTTAVALGTQGYTEANIRFIKYEYYDGVFPHSTSFTRFKLLMTNGSGTTVSDSSGNNRNGTITSGTWDARVPF